MIKLLLFSQILLFPLISQSSTKLKRSVTATTNVEAESNGYRLTGTLGQNAIGLSAKEQLKISSGYWGWIARWGVLGIDDELVIPTEFKIKPAYPNPFNPSTRIDMEIPDVGMVEIKIYDILGRMVLDHKKDFTAAGHYQFVWNPRNAAGNSLSAGTYIVTVMHENKIQTQKITFLK